jgi:hypothetical protein
MAEAFRQGNLGIMDYYRMKNVQADTAHARCHRLDRRPAGRDAGLNQDEYYTVCTRNPAKVVGLELN